MDGTTSIDWITVLQHARIPTGRERRDAWICIYTVCRGPVRARVRTLWGNGKSLDVEDIVQDVFLQASQKFDQFNVVGKPVESLTRWLCTIAHHHVIDLLREHAMERDYAQEVDEVAGPPQGDPTDRIFVERIVAGLPIEERLLVELRGSHRMPFHEIVPFIVDLRQRLGLRNKDPVTEEGVKKHWYRLHARLFAIATGKTRAYPATNDSEEDP